MYQNEKGLSAISLILIIIIIIAVVGIGLYFGKNLLKKDTLESIQTNMLKIEGKAVIISSEYELDEETPLVGVKINRIDDSYTVEGGKFTLSEELQKILLANDKKITKKMIANEEGEEVEQVEQDENELYALYYIWTQKDLDERGLKSIRITEQEFYIIDYRGPKVFYSLGYEGTYLLDELKLKEI